MSKTDSVHRKTPRRLEPSKGDVPSARDRILEAAEASFANLGFHGTSMRAVAETAGVDSFRTHYYFGSKDELLRQVLLRRVGAFNQALSGSLEAAQARAGEGALPVEAIVEAWLRPSLELALSPDPGWRHYQRLQYQLAGGPNRHHAALLTEHYRPVYELYIQALVRALPGASLASVRSAFHAIESVATALGNEDHRDPAFPSWRMQVTDTETELERLVLFYSAGFCALAARDYTQGMARATPNG